MKKEEIVKKIKVFLGIVKEKFQTAKLADGSEISFDSLEINREVYDADGNALKEGEYVLEDGTKFVVDENGVIKEITKPNGETEKEEVVTEMDETEPKGDEGNEEPKPEEPKGDEDNEVIVVKIDGVGEVKLVNDGNVYYDANGNPIDGEYKDVDNKYIVVIKGGKVMAWKPIEQPAQPDTQTTPEVVYVLNEDNKKYKVSLKEGATVKLKDGDYTDVEGEYVVTIKEGKVAGWKSAKAPEVPADKTSAVRDGVANNPFEERLKDLENKVDELYEMLLAITEKIQASDNRVEETVEEFKKLKSQPSATPLHFNKREEDTPMTRIEKLKMLKNNK